MKDVKRKRRRLGYENALLFVILASGLSGSGIALILLWTGSYTEKVQWTVSFLMFIFWLGFAFSAKQQIVRPLQTISNLLAALREEDYSIRAKRSKPGDALDDVLLEVNALSDSLKNQRLDVLEATALLSKVMREIDVAVFAFDEKEILRLVNRAGEKLLGHAAERILGHSATELNLSECLTGESSRVLEVVFPGSVGRWELRRTTFRQGGIPHHLIVLSDLSRALRHEERLAWQRLIRVIGHELNNSLTPIRSIAGSLEIILRKKPLPEDWQEDTLQGLNVIGSRAEALTKFMEAYARLARLPEPQFEPVHVPSLMKRVVNLETRMHAQLVPGPDMTIQGDQGQLEQLLINLIRNAVDVSLDQKGAVTLGWNRNGSQLEVWVEDEGPGLANPSNVFVPFFTTKPGGSGIGLVLCRQIAEGHGGEIALINKTSGHGCRALLRLPVT